MPTPPTFPVEPATPGASEILIYGKRFELFTNQVDLRTYDQPDAYSFYAYDAVTGMPLFGRRWVKPGTPVDSFEALVERVTCVILHDDLTKDSAGAFRARVGRGLSIHFMIDWDGVLWQPLDVAECAYHAGDANMTSIGVSLTHFDPKKPYTDPQYVTLVELLKTLTKRFKNIRNAYPIDRQGRLFPRALWPSGDWHGYLANKQVDAQANDPSPVFDWDRIYNSLRADNESFPLELESGRNLKSLFAPEAAKQYADRYLANNESETIGWYPMGINATWHGGIHLSAPPDTYVRALTDGVLVAACLDPHSTAIGRRAFVLLRHELFVAPEKKGNAPEKLVFFTLYMHLGAPPDDTPWLVELRARKNDPAVAILERGEIAAIAWGDDPIYVLSGQFLGTIGVLGDPPVATLHVEVFAEKAIEALPKLPGNDYFEPFIASNNNLKVVDKKILDVFGKDLSPEGLTKFWADRSQVLEKGWLRKLVVRHVSEWSDKVDWLRALAQVDGWEHDPAVFDAIVKSSGIARDAVRAVLPFIWLTKSMASHIGLDTSDWHGTLDHFHPLHFLLWLQFRANRDFVHLAP